MHLYLQNILSRMYSSRLTIVLYVGQDRWTCMHYNTGAGHQGATQIKDLKMEYVAIKFWKQPAIQSKNAVYHMQLLLHLMFDRI